MDSLLLHICCAPCLVYPLEKLEGKLKITGFYCNPNIHPYLEYRKRREALADLSRMRSLPVVYPPYILEQYWKPVMKSREDRCLVCYRTRLEATARHAAVHGFNRISTTLLYSRYQQHEAIRETGERTAAQYHLDFHYEDFRAGWSRGLKLSRKLKLYRQSYCGCAFSELERYRKTGVSACPQAETGITEGCPEK
ncbi:MAG: epoxyqueuosine reductase QueH [bacterium]